MMIDFETKLSYWYQRVKEVLDRRPELKEELEKCSFLKDYSEEFPDFTIDPVSVCGKYNIFGGNPDYDESFYTGTLTIDLVENLLEANWLIEGVQEQIGYGFVFNNTLVLNFSYMDEGDLYSGVVAYEFLTSEVISGKWTEEIAAENAFEMGRKLSPEELGAPYPEDFLSYN